VNRSSQLLCVALALALISQNCRRSGHTGNGESPEQASQAAAKPASSDLKVSDILVADPLFQDRLLRGFYGGTDGWKWTGRQFVVLLDVPPPLDAPTKLTIDYTVPIELIDAVHEVNIVARVNGGQVGKMKYSEQGRHFDEFPIPPAMLKTNPVVVEFDLDRWGIDAERRDIGLIVVGLSLQHPDSTPLDRDTATELARQGYAQLLKRRKMQMTDAQQNDMMKLFHRIPIWSKMWFQNIPIAKNPLDLWMYQQIIYETQPEFVVETGTFMGGSALYWAHTLNGMGLKQSRVFTMDVEDFTATAAKHPLWKKYVTFMKGSSTDPAIVEAIAKQVRGHRTLVTLDSDHSMQHVLEEMRAYAPLVNRGSYLVVEDTHMDGVPTSPSTGPGPMTAVLKFLEEGGSRDFEQDLSREAFVMTFNPGGWLRRK
jgi:cephalosporin hydroxylase